MKISVIIPAKGNSDRLKDKNLSKIGDKTLTEITCLKFLNSKKINEVYLDTDSEKIIDDVSYLFKNGLRLIKRPKELANNSITANDLIIYALHCIEKCDIILQSFVTSPTLKIKTIDDCIEKFIKSKKNDSFFTVEEMKEYFWSKEGKPLNFDIKVLPNSIDLEKKLKETHGLYGIYTKSLLKNKTRFGLNPMLIPISKLESLDINDAEDLKIVRAINDYDDIK